MSIPADSGAWRATEKRNVPRTRPITKINFFSKRYAIPARRWNRTKEGKETNLTIPRIRGGERRMVRNRAKEERREAGASGEESAGAKSGKSVPTDSTPFNEPPTVKPAAMDGQGRDGRRSLPVRLPPSEGSPIAINKANFPRVQHPPQVRVVRPPPRHQRSVPYMETHGCFLPPSGYDRNPLGEPPGHPPRS